MSSSDAKRKRHSLRVPLFIRFVVGFALCGVVLNAIAWHLLLPLLMGAPRAPFEIAENGTRPPLPDLAPDAMKQRVERARAIFTKLGSHPTAAEGRALAAEGIGLRYLGPGGEWETRSDLPDWDQLHRSAMPFPFDRSIAIGPRFVHRELADGELAVFFDDKGPPNPFLDPHFRVILLGQTLSMVLLCLFFAVWQFRPLRSLTAATRRIGSGELGVTVPVTQRSELGDLAQAFNDMSGRILALVKAREDLLADISHELRSPLARIRMAVEVRGAAGKESIRRNVQEMSTLVDQLLEGYRLERGADVLERRPEPIHRLLEDVASSYAPKGRRVLIPVRREAIVACDGERLRRVLTNLVDNALKYSTGDVELGVEELAQTVLVRVRDHGPGVPEAELERIFEPFRRLDVSRSKATGGYGLGLDLCRRVVQAHGGSIRARNRAGGGLEVLFELPKRFG